MSRPRSYDREDAVKQACMAFWAHGYQALGVREIEAQTGLNQYAIRSEFGGKEGLYLEALNFYSNAAISMAMAAMKDGGLADVVTFLKNLVTECELTSSPWGCLITNTGVENARIGSTKLDDAVKSYWHALERHFYDALKASSERREIDANANPAAIAKGLVTAVMGVHVKNRSTGSFEGGRDLVELVCAYLNSLRT